eukprot:SAG22_NODE_4439_length_1268_cov_3.111206_1_plen_290_part_10
MPSMEPPAVDAEETSAAEPAATAAGHDSVSDAPAAVELNPAAAASSSVSVVAGDGTSLGAAAAPAGDGLSGGVPRDEGAVPQPPPPQTQPQPPPPRQQSSTQQPGSDAEAGFLAEAGGSELTPSTSTDSKSSRSGKFKEYGDKVRSDVRVKALQRMGESAVQQVHSDVISLYGRSPTDVQDAAVTRRPPCILHPDSKFRVGWDVLQAAALLYLAVTVPLRMSFDIQICSDNPVFWFEAVIDLMFVVDIFLNFSTAYVDKRAFIGFAAFGMLPVLLHLATVIDTPLKTATP